MSNNVDPLTAVMGVPKEPRITINNVMLTEAQSMSVRVAIDVFSAGLEAHGLGDDDHGAEMVRLYRGRLAEVKEYIFIERSKEEYNEEERTNKKADESA
jgi:hypothetical protein